MKSLYRARYASASQVVSLGKELARCASDKQRVVDQIAPGKAARLLNKSKQPFEPRTLHPMRRLPHAPNQQIERGPNSDENLCLRQDRHVLCHKVFLLGCAQADPEKIRSREANAFLKIAQFDIIEATKWRRVSPDDS